MLEQIIDGSQVANKGILASLRNRIFGESLAAELLRPTDMTLDALGRLLVVDHEASSIVRFILQDGQWVWLDRIQPEAVRLPLGIAASATHIFISDAESGQVHVLDLDLNPVRTITEENFEKPGDLCFCSKHDRLFVADPRAHSVFIFSGEGKYLAQIGREGRGAALLHYPMSLAVNPGTDELLVLDGIARKVKRYSSDFKFLGDFGEYDQVPGTLAFPKGIARASDETLFISDAAFGNIQLFDPKGALLFFVGRTGNGPAEFLLPRNLYMSPDQKLFVADPYNNRIQIFQYNPQP